MTSEYPIEELVPHSGRMSLLTRVVEYGDEWLIAEVDITPSSMFCDDQGVPAWVGLEYLAQAIAAYAGLQERLTGGSPKIGFLVGTRKYICSNDYFPINSTLSIKVSQNLKAENGLCVFDCELLSSECEASARLNVFQPEDADQFIRNAKSE